MARRYDFIDLRIPKLAEVTPSYEAMLPALGFTRGMEVSGWLQYESVEGGRAAFFGGDLPPAGRSEVMRIAVGAFSTQVSRAIFRSHC